MFEQIAKEIYTYSLNKLKNSPPFFSYKHLSEVDLHPAIIKYISAELDFMIYEDRQNLLRDSAFDYSGKKISEHFNAIAKEIKQTKRFSSDHIKNLIKHSVSFNLYFISQPKKTLLKFLFGKETHRTTDEIRQMLNYTFYYDYLLKIISAYLDKKKIISINYNEMKQLLEKIDSLSAVSDKENLINSAFYAIDNFFNIDKTPKGKIHLNPFLNFLRDKNLLDEIEKIENEIFTDDEKFPLEEIKKILFDYEDDLESEDILEDTQPLENIDLTDEEERKQNFTYDENALEIEPEEEIEENQFYEESKIIDDNFEETRNDFEISHEKPFSEKPFSEEAFSEELSVEELTEDETLLGNTEFDKKNLEESLAETEINGLGNFELSEEETIEDFSEHKTAEALSEKLEKEILGEAEETFSREINVTALLENKKASKLVENLFEYDMDEFSSLIEKIEKSPNEEDVYDLIDNYGNSLGTKKTKEIEQFKEIISEYL